MYLGDGCINKEPRCEKLRIFCDASYPGIIDEIKSSITDLLPDNSVNTIDRQTFVVVYCYSRHWSTIFPQHGPDKKHKRKIKLEAWQKKDMDHKAFLRGLIHSDGCRSINNTKGYLYPRYSFCNTSSDINRIFRSSCKNLGIKYTVSYRQNIKNRMGVSYITRKDDVKKLDEFIGDKH